MPQNSGIMNAPKMMRTKTDCLRACLATVADISYEATPDLSNSKQCIESLRSWLLGIGYDVCFIDPQDYQSREFDLLIGVGPSPRIKGKDHAVVINSAMDIVHDPSPEGTPIDNISYIILIRRANDF